MQTARKDPFRCMGFLFLCAAVSSTHTQYSMRTTDQVTSHGDRVVRKLRNKWLHNVRRATRMGGLWSQCTMLAGMKATVETVVWLVAKLL